MEQVRNVQLHVTDLINGNSYLQQSSLAANPAHSRSLAVVKQSQVERPPRLALASQQLRLELVLPIQALLREVLRVHNLVVLVVRLELGDLGLCPAPLGHVQQPQPIPGEPIPVTANLLHDIGPVGIERGHVELRQARFEPGPDRVERFLYARVKVGLAEPTVLEQPEHLALGRRRREPEGH